MKAKVVGFDSESRWVSLQWLGPETPPITIGEEWEIHPPGDVCEWTEDENGPWSTSCGKTWVFEYDGPKENECSFCCFCGKPLKEVKK